MNFPNEGLMNFQFVADTAIHVKNVHQKHPPFSRINRNETHKVPLNWKMKCWRYFSQLKLKVPGSVARRFELLICYFRMLLTAIFIFNSWKEWLPCDRNEVIEIIRYSILSFTGIGFIVKVILDRQMRDFELEVNIPLKSINWMTADNIFHERWLLLRT